jgi:hypothetical protein
MLLTEAPVMAGAAIFKMPIRRDLIAADSCMGIVEVSRWRWAPTRDGMIPVFTHPTYVGSIAEAGRLLDNESAQRETAAEIEALPVVGAQSREWLRLHGSRENCARIDEAARPPPFACAPADADEMAGNICLLAAAGCEGATSLIEGTSASKLLEKVGSQACAAGIEALLGGRSGLGDAATQLMQDMAHDAAVEGMRSDDPDQQTYGWINGAIWLYLSGAAYQECLPKAKAQCSQLFQGWLMRPREPTCAERRRAAADLPSRAEALKQHMAQLRDEYARLMESLGRSARQPEAEFARMCQR